MTNITPSRVTVVPASSVGARRLVGCVNMLTPAGGFTYFTGVFIYENPENDQVNSSFVAKGGNNFDTMSPRGVKTKFQSVKSKFKP